MPSGFLPSADNLEQIQWNIDEETGINTAEVKVRGFGWRKHRYQITHDSKEHTLAVTRMYKKDGSKVGEKVQLGYVKQTTKEHKTSQWMVKLLLTRGNAIKHEEKGRIIAKAVKDKPELDEHCGRMLDWLSDGGFREKLPKMGVSSTATPTQAAERTEVAKGVVTSFVHDGSEKILNLLKGKSETFQISILKHLLTPRILNSGERNALMTSLLTLEHKRVERLLMALAIDAMAEVDLGSESQTTTARDKYKSAIAGFISTNPAKFAEIVNDKAFSSEALNLILCTASTTEYLGQASEFYRAICPRTTSTSGAGIATTHDTDTSKTLLQAFSFIIDSLEGDSHPQETHTSTGSPIEGPETLEVRAEGPATPQEAYVQGPYPRATHDSEGFTVLEVPVGELVTSEASKACMQQILKANCGFPEVIPSDRRPTVIECVKHMKQDEQVAILFSCLEQSDSLTDFQVQLLTEIINKDSKLDPEICELLCKEANAANFWALFDKDHRLAKEILCTQSPEAKAGCVQCVIKQESLPSPRFAYALECLQEQTETLQQLCLRADIRELLIYLMQKAPTEFAKVTLAQDKTTQCDLISVILNSTVIAHRGTSTSSVQDISQHDVLDQSVSQEMTIFMKLVLAPKNKYRKEIFESISNQERTLEIIELIATIDSELTVPVLLVQSTETQQSWLRNARNKANALDKNRPVALALLGKENPHHCQLRTLSCAADYEQSWLPELLELHPEAVKEILLAEDVSIQYKWIQLLLQKYGRAAKYTCIKALLTQPHETKKEQLQTALFSAQTSTEAFCVLLKGEPELVVSTVKVQNWEAQLRWLQEVLSKEPISSQEKGFITELLTTEHPHLDTLKVELSKAAIGNPRIKKLMSLNHELAQLVLEKLSVNTQYDWLEYMLQNSTDSGCAECITWLLAPNNPHNLELKTQLFNKNVTEGLLPTLAAYDASLTKEILKTQTSPNQLKWLQYVCEAEPVNDDMLDCIKFLLSPDNAELQTLREEVCLLQGQNKILPKLIALCPTEAEDTIAKQKIDAQCFWVSTLLENEGASVQVKCAVKLLTAHEEDSEKLKTALCKQDDVLPLFKNLATKTSLSSTLLESQDLETQVTVVCKLIPTEANIEAALLEEVSTVLAKEDISEHFFNQPNARTAITRLFMDKVPQVKVLLESRDTDYRAEVLGELVDSKCVTQQNIELFTNLISEEVSDKFLSLSAQTVSRFQAIFAISPDSAVAVLHLAKLETQEAVLVAIAKEKPVNTNLLNKCIPAKSPICLRVGEILEQDDSATQIFLALIEGNAEFTFNLVSGLDQNKQQAILVNILPPRPIEGARREFIQLLLSSSNPQLVHLRKCIVESADCTQTLGSLAEMEPSVAASVCTGQSPQTIAQLAKGMLSAQEDMSKPHVIDFIGQALSGGSKLAVLAELVTLAQGHKALLNLYKAQQALVTGSLKEMDAQQQLQILVGLTTFIDVDSTEAKAIFAVLVSDENLHQKELLEQLSQSVTCQTPVAAFRVLELIIENSPNSAFLSLVDNHNDLLLKECPKMQRGVQVALLMYLKEIKHESFSTILVCICKANETEAAEFILSFINAPSNPQSDRATEFLNLFQQPQHCLPIVKYLPIDFRKEMALSKDPRVDGIFIELLSPIVPSQAELTEGDAITGWPTLISKSVCQQIVVGAKTTVQKRLAGIMADAEPKACASMLTAVLKPEQLEAQLAQIKQSLSKEQLQLILIEVAKINHEVIAIILSKSSVLLSSDKTIFVRELPHELQFEVIKAIPTNSTSGISLARNKILQDLIEAPGLRKVYCLGEKPFSELRAEPKFELMLKHVGVLPRNLVPRLLKTPQFTVADKCYLIAHGKLDKSKIISALGELSALEDTSQYGIPSFERFAQQLPEEIIIEATKGNASKGLSKIISALPKEKLKQMVQNSAPDYVFCSKLSPKTLLVDLGLSPKELTNILSSLNRSGQTQFVTDCLQVLNSANMEGLLTSLFTESQPPLSCQLSVVMQSIGVLLKVVAGKPAPQVIELCHKCDVSALNTIVCSPAVLNSPESKKQFVVYCLDQKTDWLEFAPPELFGPDSTLELSHLIRVHQHFQRIQHAKTGEVTKAIQTLVLSSDKGDDIAEFSQVFTGKGKVEFVRDCLQTHPDRLSKLPPEFYEQDLTLALEDFIGLHQHFSKQQGETASRLLHAVESQVWNSGDPQLKVGFSIALKNEDKVKHLEYCLEHKPTWLSELPHEFYTPMPTLSVEVCIKLHKHYQSSHSPSAAQIIKTISEKVWQSEQDDDIVTFIVELSGSQLMNFLGLTPHGSEQKQLDGFNQVDPKILARLIASLKSVNHMIRLVDKLPHEPLKLTYNALVESSEHSEIKAAGSLHSAQSERFVPLVTVKNLSRFVNKTLSSAMARDSALDLWFSSLKEPSQICQAVFEALPDCQGGFFKYVLTSEVIKQINAAEKSDELKVAVYLKMPIKQKKQFFEEGMSPELARDYISQDGAASRGRLLWSVLSNESPFWAEAFADLPSGILLENTETFLHQRGSEFIIRSLRLMKPEFQRAVCEQLKAKPNFARTMNEVEIALKLKEPEPTRPQVQFGAPIGTSSQSTTSHDNVLITTTSTLGPSPEPLQPSTVEPINSTVRPTDSYPSQLDNLRPPEASTTVPTVNNLDHLPTDSRATQQSALPTLSLDEFNIEFFTVLGTDNFASIAPKFFRLKTEDQVTFFTNEDSCEMAITLYPEMPQRCRAQKKNLVEELIRVNAGIAPRLVTAIEKDKTFQFEIFRSHPDFVERCRGFSPNLVGEFESTNQTTTPNQQRSSPTLQTAGNTYPLQGAQATGSGGIEDESWYDQLTSSLQETIRQQSEVQLNGTPPSQRTATATTPHSVTPPTGQNNLGGNTSVSTPTVVTHQQPEGAEVKPLRQQKPTAIKVNNPKGPYHGEFISALLSDSEAKDYVLKKGSQEEVVALLRDIVEIGMFDEVDYAFTEKLTPEYAAQALLRYFTTETRDENETKQDNTEWARDILIRKLGKTPQMVQILTELSKLCVDKCDIALFHELKKEVMNKGQKLDSIPEPTLTVSSTPKVSPSNVVESVQQQDHTQNTGLEAATLTPQHTPTVAVPSGVSEDAIQQAQMMRDKSQLRNLVLQLFKQEDSRAQTYYRTLDIEQKAELIKRLSPGEVALSSNYLKADPDILPAFRFLAEQAVGEPLPGSNEPNVVTSLAAELNQKLHNINDDGIVREVWVYKPDLTKYVQEGTFSIERHLELSPVGYDPLQAPKQIQVRSCEFAPGANLQHTADTMFVPTGFERLTVDGYGDCLFRTILLRETKNDDVRFIRKVPMAQVRTMMSERQGGDPARLATIRACKNVLADSGLFSVFSEQLSTYAIERGATGAEFKETEADAGYPVAEWLYRKLFENNSFNYFYPNGIKNCFTGLDVDSMGLTSHFDSFCDQMSEAITQNILTEVGLVTEVNKMTTPDTPVLVLCDNHYDLLVPTHLKGQYRSYTQ
ncbi:hypothetical protein SOPP22_07340 [Shewanella sp. OPT22]|nr:hypothetical protein SOPP22_07340 [Shewanella sp. OPT22]